MIGRSFCNFVLVVIDTKLPKYVYHDLCDVYN